MDKNSINKVENIMKNDIDKKVEDNIEIQIKDISNSSIKLRKSRSKSDSPRGRYKVLNRDKIRLDAMLIENDEENTKYLLSDPSDSDSSENNYHKKIN